MYPADQVQHHDRVQHHQDQDDRPARRGHPTRAAVTDQHHAGYGDQPQHQHRSHDRAGTDLGGPPGHRQPERAVRRWHVPPANIDGGHHRRGAQRRDAHPVGVEAPPQQLALRNVVVDVGGEHRRTDSERGSPGRRQPEHRPGPQSMPGHHPEYDQPQHHQQRRTGPRHRRAQTPQSVGQGVDVGHRPAHWRGAGPLRRRLATEYHGQRTEQSGEAHHVQQRRRYDSSLARRRGVDHRASPSA
jgi:hypothetical protein